MTDNPSARTVAAAIAAAGMPAIMLSVSTGFVPRPQLAAPVWWLLPVVAFGYWITWVAWARDGSISGR